MQPISELHIDVRTTVFSSAVLLGAVLLMRYFEPPHLKLIRA
jgi:hypothetical protein